MYKRIFACIITAVLCLSIFTACKAPEGEQATLGSNDEAATVKNTIEDAEELISIAEEANATATPEAFNNALSNPDLHAAAYYGPHDITIAESEHIAKTVSVKTTGKVELNSSCDAMVLLAADGGFTANAEAGKIILKGENINADIKYDCGEIYISGKNATLHIHSGTVTQVTARNTTAVICNHTDTPVKVVLTNGSSVTVEGGHNYQLKDNLITKGLIDG
ncbi:MAG: hypothetical protein E7573_03980 [Ruminococcaceae bacterium]|nr:hypothetical protein [Oscillospiraceae bacterium]MBR3596963.1 hypothetical protein [Clostridia bacterium]